MGEMMVEILLWGILVFSVGSVLLLERHCLGQRALVQPLVLCLVVGMVSDHLETALWLGVTLQLMSVSPIRAVDWALAGAVAAVTLAFSTRLGYTVEVGDPGASLLIVFALIVGTLARYIEREFARIDNERGQMRSALSAADCASTVERTVYRAIRRWILVGGSEALVGAVLGTLVVIGGSELTPTEGWLRTISSVGCPVLGVAVALSALSELRFVAWSGVSMGLSLLGAWLVFS